jgi:GAF domain-containing protein
MVPGRLTRFARTATAKDGTMPVNASVLAGSIAGLADLDPTLHVAHALQQAVTAATRLFRVDGAGVMLADPDGRLRWAVASNQRVQLAGDHQEVLAQGPCQVAFAQGRPVHLRDAGTERAWGEIALLYVEVGLPASLSVPLELAGGPVGTLDLFARAPRDWHDTNVAALKAYAGLMASLLWSAARAEVRGALASQLQTTLEQQAAPVAALAWLRLVGGSKGRPVADAAREFLGPDGQAREAEPPEPAGSRPSALAASHQRPPTRRPVRVGPHPAG